MAVHDFDPRKVNARPSALPTIKDAYGRVLTPGDEVICPGMTAPRFQLQDVVPNMDPRAPTGSKIAVFQCAIRMVVVGDGPIPQIIRTQTAAEQGIQAAPEGLPPTLSDGMGGKVTEN